MARPCLPRTGEMTDNDIKWPHWLTKKLAIRFLIWLIAGISIGPVVLTIIDQWLRNSVDDWMSGPDLYDSLSISPDEYQELPLHWRQALAEIAVRDSSESVALKSLVKALSIEDMQLISHIAPYAIHHSASFVVRNDSRTRHPMPELSLLDFGALEILGLFQPTELAGLTWRIDDNLFGMTAAIEVQQLDGTQEPPSLGVTVFSDVGHELVCLLRMPSNLGYFSWVAQEIEKLGEGNLKVELIASGKHEPKSSCINMLAEYGRIGPVVTDWKPMTSTRSDTQP